MTLKTLPVYSISRIMTIRKKLLDEVFYQYHGVEFAGAAFRDLVSEVRDTMPKGIEYGVLHESLRPVLGQVLTKEMISDVAWRLAGNVSRLRGGVAVGPWLAPGREEWVPIHVIRVDRKYKLFNVKNDSGSDEHEKFGAMVTLRILAGGPAGKKLSKFWSSGFVRVICPHLGFSKFNRLRYNRDPSRELHNYPYMDIRELYNLRLFGHIDPKISAEGPNFSDVRSSSSTLSWNRQIFQKRRRINFPCPRDFVHQCYECPIGLMECPAACHFSNFTEKPCAKCNVISQFDTERSDEMCIDCLMRQ